MNYEGDEEDEDEEAMDRSRSPSPPHAVFAGPIVRSALLFSICCIFQELSINWLLNVNFVRVLEILGISADIQVTLCT